MIADRYYFQEHRMLWAALGFMSGLTLATSMQHSWWIVFVVLFGLLVRRIYQGKKFIVLLIFLCLFLCGICLWNRQMIQTASVLQEQLGETVQVSGTVLESESGQSYLWLRATTCNDTFLDHKERLYITVPPNKIEDKNDMGREAEKASWYPPGTKLVVQGTIRMPQGQRNPGGFNEQQWLRSKKVQYKLLTDQIQIVKPPTGIWSIALYVHNFMEQTAASYLSQQEAATVLALLLGEKQQLSPEFYRLAQRMGIAHMFAVSGLHVGFVGALFLFLFRICGWDRSWLSFLLLSLGLFFYCVLTGLPPSALRAATMIVLAALAVRLRRPPTSIDFLAMAALLILYENPFLLWTAGFQLSFGVTLSLLLFAMPLNRAFRWISWPWLRGSVAVAVAAYLGSLPLSAWHFYAVSLFAPLFNLILVPVVSILVPVLLVCFLLTALFPIGGAVFFFPVHLLLQILIQGTLLLGQWIGHGQWFVGRPGLLALLCYFCFCFVLWHLLHRMENRNRTEQLFAISLLLLAILLSLPRPPATDELLYLDTGQGSCAILRTKAGETIIFDGGAQQRELASCLAWYGVNRVKAIILSHADTDHINGIAQVLEGIPVTYLLMETSQMQRETMIPLLMLAKKQGTNFKAINETALLRNPHGTVVFPGDLSVQGVHDLIKAERQISIWTVPHHGSRNSANQEIYQELKEKGVRLAVISAGIDNRYGHPHTEVLQLLQQTHIPWRRTDEQGAILLKLGK